ncbi:helix-turn-helix transcriptional regulator [Saccharothrix algeriensis]|uniref:Helix-turn-helix transcriptional regulator n=1 Tax=Saccharothrix algeriensis TaxID=173560 RepID=A0A8T8I3P0_9PSEU|nr:helix-turn-helix transcriptional regulator [Saccharothrix algeriensis]
MDAADESEPTDREVLAAELRRVRDLAGVSGRELAQRIGISQSKVSRIESGTTVPTTREVKGWSTALEVSADMRDRLLALTEAVRTEVRPWGAVLRSKGHIQDDIRELEHLALKVRVYQPSVVPGLLQTAEYARTVFSLGGNATSEADLSAALMGRLRRQEVLFEEGRDFEFLITEAALRWRPGPPRLLLAQLDRIMSVGTLTNVSIGLIPHSAPAVTFYSHGFVIYDLADEDRSTEVAVETVHAKLAVREQEGLDLYEERWSALRRMALFGDAARGFLAALATGIRELGGGSR